MKVFIKEICVLIILFYFIGCVTQPIKNFTQQDFMLIKPFKQKDTVVYLSSKGQTDTIIFYPAKVDTNKYRNFEQGFYDQYVLSVNYNLLSGSYHKFILTDKNNGMEDLYSCSISDISIRELSFLGIVFSKDMLDNLLIDSGKIITFNSYQAQYQDVNINEGIRSFTFSTQIGIISYVDTNNIEWVRIPQQS